MKNVQHVEIRRPTGSESLEPRERRGCRPRCVRGKREDSSRKWTREEENRVVGSGLVCVEVGSPTVEMAGLSLTVRCYMISLMDCV